MLVRRYVETSGLFVHKYLNYGFGISNCTWKFYDLPNTIQQVFFSNGYSSEVCTSTQNVYFHTVVQTQCVLTIVL